MDYGTSLVYLIDARFAHENAEDGMRTHLGASVVGGVCLRQVWYHFHWCDVEFHEGRMLRLFKRGHDEEEKVVALLRMMGCTVWTVDSEGKQYRISDHGGHFGGAMDGVAMDLPYTPSMPAGMFGCAVLLEIKTHSEKYFRQICKEGVAKAKPVHYRQAQTYMHKSGLKWCLYCGTNKNDDHMYFEVIAYDPSVGTYMLQRAQTAIFGWDLPPRISNTPSWYECRFCEMKAVCFKTKMPKVNCRTCAFAQAMPDGTWKCHAGQEEIDTKPKEGCGNHMFSPALFPHLTYKTKLDTEGCMVGIIWTRADGAMVINGPMDTNSHVLDLC